EGRPLPDLCNQDGDVDQVRVDGPEHHHRLAVQPAEDLVDGTEAVVEHQRPGGAGDDGRYHDREHEQGDEYCAGGDRLDEQLCHCEAQHQFYGQRDDREEGGVEQRLPQSRVGEEQAIVEQALERGVHVGHGDVLETHHDEIDEGEYAEQQQYEDRRRDQA